ncbi:MAG TPA: transglycosylase family protein [Candidatus Saccharimonadales bacterium]|jgi:uncharacterized protein YabE (DUF348 family)|nr:transglycosylase family protein [Candidatus Saccharimonadales bacterium]
MNKLSNTLNKYLWVGLGIVLAGMTGLFFLMSQQAVAAKPGERLVTIYQDGQQQSLVTNATTVRDVLSRAHVSLGTQDAVEPSLDTQLVATSYNINIYRARPVTILDGNLRVTVVSPYQSAKQIAQSAHITTYPEDELTLGRIDDFVSEGTLGLKLTIKRATPFTLVLYGQPLAAHTQDKTVGDMLKNKGVKLAAQDGTSVPVDTPITADMTVQVWRNGVQTKTEQQPIAFPIRQVQAADQPVGYKQIQTPGTNGQKLVTYQLNLQNGVEISRQEIQSVVTLAPSEQVEIVGSKPSFSGSFADALSVLRACEAGGTYTRNSGNGYYGAYQFDQGSWNAHAPSAYTGLRPDLAPPSAQDQAVWNYYQKSGWRPWPVCGAQKLPDIYR